MAGETAENRENHLTVFDHEKRITKEEVLGVKREEARVEANRLVVARLDDLTNRLNALVAERFAKVITREDIEAIVRDTEVSNIKVVTAGSELSVKQLLAAVTGLVALSGTLAGTVAFLAMKVFGA